MIRKHQIEPKEPAMDDEPSHGTIVCEMEVHLFVVVTSFWRQEMLYVEGPQRCIVGQRPQDAYDIMLARWKTCIIGSFDAIIENVHRAGWQLCGV